MDRPTPPATENNPDVNLNLNVRGLHKSATLAINEQCRELQAAGRHVYRLGLGQSPFPVPESVVEKLRAHAHQKDYLPVKGLPALREAIAAYYHRREGDRPLPRGHPGRPRLEGADVHPPAGLLRRPRDPHPELGHLCPAGPHHRPAHQLGPDHGGGRVAPPAGRARRRLPQRPQPTPPGDPQLPLQPHRPDLQRGGPRGARRGGAPVPGHPPLRRDLRRAPPQRASTSPSRASTPRARSSAAA